MVEIKFPQKRSYYSMLDSGTKEMENIEEKSNQNRIVIQIKSVLVVNSKYGVRLIVLYN